MALTIRMRIDENDEHSYYYATGSGSEIELIPLVVDENGVYTPDEGKAYNRVTVSVPETELETLIVSTNGTYNAPDGKAYNVVTVNVEPILEAVSRSYSSNGTYTIQPTEGKDGISSVTVVVDVPAEEPNLETLNEYIDDNGTFTYSPSQGYDGFDGVTIEVDVPQSGGNSNTDVVYFTPENSGALQMAEIRANETPQAIYVFSVEPDMLMFNGADVISNFACCVNSVYDGVNYTYDSVVESSNYGQITTDNNPMLVLDGFTPTILPQSAGYDAFGIDSGHLYGYFLDVNDTTGFGLSGDYIIVVVYGVQPPL